MREPSFLKSFLKGSIFSLLLIVGFISIVYFTSPSYEQGVKDNLPSVIVNIRNENIPTPNVANIENVLPDNIQDITKEDNNPEEQTNIYLSNLTEETQFGLLPRPDIDKNLTPFDAYKRNFIRPTGQRKFKLIIGPIGFSAETAKNIAEKLPQDVSILLTPYAPNLDKIVSIFKDSGHEIWLELPVETYDVLTKDTGPLSLRADFSGNKNMSIYKQTMGRTKGYTGLFMRNANNSTLSFSSARMEELQADIYSRGLGLAYASNNQITQLDKIANSYRGNLRPVTNSFEGLFSNKKEMWNNLISSNQDTQVLYRPHMTEIDLLRQWLQRLPEKGYVLAPLSAEAE